LVGGSYGRGKLTKKESRGRTKLAQNEYMRNYCKKRQKNDGECGEGKKS